MGVFFCVESDVTKIIKSHSLRHDFVLMSAVLLGRNVPFFGYINLFIYLSLYIFFVERYKFRNLFILSFLKFFLASK